MSIGKSYGEGQVLKAAPNAAAADPEESWKQITKLAERERELDPRLTTAASITKALRTPEGRRHQQAYNDARRRTAVVPVAPEVEKATPMGLCCPYWLEITRLAKQEVAKHAKAGDRISEADALVSVMKQRPWLYRAHKEAH